MVQTDDNYVLRAATVESLTEQIVRQADTIEMLAEHLEACKAENDADKVVLGERISVLEEQVAWLTRIMLGEGGPRSVVRAQPFLTDCRLAETSAVLDRLSIRGSA